MPDITDQQLRATGNVISLSDSTDEHQYLLWQPELAHSRRFPAEFQLRVKLASNRENTLVAPCDGEYPLKHFRGGIGIMHVWDALPNLSDFNHSGLFTLYQKGPNLREFLDRRFLSLADLRRRGRNAREKSGVLPVGLGATDGRGTGWTIARLQTEGEQLASERSQEPPSPEQVIRLGFLAAARLNPLWIEPTESASLVRNAFFALPPDAGAIPDEVRTFVCDQLALAMLDRLDTLDRFNSIITDRKADIPRRISKVKGPGGRKVSRDVIRRVYLDLCWQSLVFCGLCVEVQMRAIQVHLPTLSTDSEQLYRLRYYCHPKFGGLPLAMAGERTHFLREAIVDVWGSNGDDKAFAVLNRMLAYYAELNDERRASDRQYASERGNVYVGRASTIESLQVEQAASPEKDREPSFREIVKLVLIERKVAIESDFTGDWVAHLKAHDATHVTFEIECSNPALCSDHRCTVEEMKAAGIKLFKRA